MNQSDLARQLGVSKSLLTKYKNMGCPMDCVESIRAWRQTHIIDRGPKLEGMGEIEGIEEIESLTIESLDCAMPEGEDPKDVVNRLKDLERKLYAQIIAAREYLSKHKDAKLSAKLPQLRREYRDTTKLLLAAHCSLQQMDIKRETLIER
jgi:transcriptional regulator with XRE-family HTH domain